MTDRQERLVRRDLDSADDALDKGDRDDHPDLDDIGGRERDGQHHARRIGQRLGVGKRNLADGPFHKADEIRRHAEFIHAHADK